MCRTISWPDAVTSPLPNHNVTFVHSVHIVQIKINKIQHVHLWLLEMLPGAFFFTLGLSQISCFGFGPHEL